MKKLFKNILFDTLVFTVIYFILFFILKQFDLIFMPWIRKLAMIVIPIGIYTGVIQAILKLEKGEIITKIFAWIGFAFLFLVITIVMYIYVIFFYSEEKIVYYEETKMVKETVSRFKTFDINYYEYTNPFIRSRQERVVEHYDDTLHQDGYRGTTYYNKDGVEIENFNAME